MIQTHVHGLPGVPVTDAGWCSGEGLRLTYEVSKKVSKIKNEMGMNELHESEK